MDVHSGAAPPGKYGWTIVRGRRECVSGPNEARVDESPDRSRAKALLRGA